MELKTACELIGQIVYRPDWHFEATDFSHRFEGTMTLLIHYPARNTNRDQASAEYPTTMQAAAQFTIVAADCKDETALYRCIIDRILEIEQHEAREYFRVRPTFWAPFHPHKVDGMKRWGTPDADLRFGIV